MGHPHSGRIQAFIDGETDRAETAELQAHLDACQKCRSEEEALRTCSRALAGALELLDSQPSLQEAKDRFQSRQHSKPATFWPSLSPLARAASVALLLTGITVSALPGSPVRSWVARGWEMIRPSSAPVPATVAPEVDDQTAAPLPGSIPETGAGLPVLGQGVEISLENLPTESELRVLWVEGTEAWVYAGEGTRFTLLDGRLEVTYPMGNVRVELPRGPGSILLLLNGELLLRKRGEAVEVVGPVKERTPDGIVFQRPLP